MQLPVPDLSRTYPSSLGGQVGWRNVTVTSFAPVLLMMGGEPVNNSVAFAFAEYTTKTAGQANITFSISGTGKLWLNGVPLSAGRDELDAGLLAREQTVQVSLRAGRNYILVKTLNNWCFGEAQWALHLSIFPISTPVPAPDSPSAECSHALAGCWPVKDVKAKCHICEGMQQQRLHAAGCTQEDIETYCSTKCNNGSQGMSWTGATQLAYRASCNSSSCCCTACTTLTGCVTWMTIDSKHGATHPGCYLFGPGGRPDGVVWPGYTTGSQQPPPPSPSYGLYNDLWSPRFHYYASPHMMDPAAAFHANGIWHLFHDLETPVTEIPQWSHASSPDAVHWERQPIAIPFGVTGACDEGFAETGGVGVRDDGVAVALYAGGTRHTGRGPGRSGTTCNICASVSTDKNHSVWRKVKDVVVPNLNNGSDWRDSTRPFRMPGDHDNWWMIIGTSGSYGGTPIAAKAALFVNKDGSQLHWEERGIFFSDANYHMMECPDAFPLSNRSDADSPFFFMASATVGTGQAVGARWWVGRVDRSNPERPRFVKDFDGLWDYGSQVSGDVAMAIPTYTSVKSGPAVGGTPRLIFSWVRGDGLFSTDWWRQHMAFNGVSAFPREIRVTSTPRGGGRALRQSFIAAVASLRVRSTEISLQSRCLAPQSRLPLAVHGRAQEILATFGPTTQPSSCPHRRPDPTTESSFGFSVFAACNTIMVGGRQCEETLVGYTRSDSAGGGGGFLFVDRTNSTVFPMGRSDHLLIQRAPLGLSESGTLRLHVLLDFSIIEVIADNGTHSAAITSRVYPLFNSSDGVPQLWASGSNQYLVSVLASQLAAIF